MLPHEAVMGTFVEAKTLTLLSFTGSLEEEAQVYTVYRGT
jgi:hypothetical protein